MIYFVVGKGLPPGLVGLGFSMAGAAGFLGTMVFGRIADKWGSQRGIIVSSAGLAALYCTYPLVNSQFAYFAVVTIVGFFEWGNGPLFHGLVADFFSGDQLVRARAELRSLFNVGFSVGAVLASAVLGVGPHAAFMLPIANAISFIVLVALALQVSAPNATTRAPNRIPSRGPFMDHRYVLAVGASALLALNGTVLLVGIPAWLIQVSIVPHWVIPLIFILNTVLVVLLQVRASAGSESVNGAVRAARLSGLMSSVAAVLLLGSDSASLLVTGLLLGAAVLALTFGELLQSASAFGLSYGLAPADRRGKYLGVFHLHMVAQATLGPALVLSLLQMAGILGWLLIGGLFALGAVLISFVRQHPPAASAS